MLVLCIVRAASELIMLTPEMFGDKCLNKINYVWDPLQNLYYTKNVSNLTSAGNAFMHEKICIYKFREFFHISHSIIDDQFFIYQWKLTIHSVL